VVRAIDFPQLTAVFSFSCSCIVSSSSGEVGQFSFESCPLFQDISSEIHYLPCFGSDFLLCLFTEISMLGFYFFVPPPFSGVGSVFHQPLLLTVWCLFFSFMGKFSFGCCSLVQEMISVIYYFLA
jgi:hypothetical protein